MVMGKLKEINQKFDDKDLAVDEKNLPRDFQILRNCVPMYFPSVKETKEIMNQLDVKKQSNNLYERQYLPLHTQDMRWLARLFQAILKEQNKMAHENGLYAQEISENLNAQYQACGINFEDDKNKKTIFVYQQPDIHLGTIRRFIETDKSFKDALARFEVDMTQVYIDSKLDDDYMQKLTPEQRQDTDKVFYQDVVNTMTKTYGIAQHSAEIGLEKLAKYWQKPAMKDAYYHTYEFRGLPQDQWQSFTISRKEFEPTWTKLRMAQYYATNHNVIDEIGTTKRYPDINNKEGKALINEVNLWNHFCLKYIKPKDIESDNNKTL